MLTFYKTCFFVYKAALIGLIYITFTGSTTIDSAGEDTGLDGFAISFLSLSILIIGLGLVLQFIHLPKKLKHLFSYIVTLLIFGTVLFDAYMMYDSITVEDYSIVFWFLVFFTLAAALSFYAVITKKIEPYPHANEE